MVISDAVDYKFTHSHMHTHAHMYALRQKMSYHGDPNRDHKFWVYPKGSKLPNPKWDTHDAKSLCDNHQYVFHHIFTGVHEYRCGGHGVGPERYMKDGKMGTAREHYLASKGRDED